ncbi:MAG: hypothetical protein KDA32_00740 [Phycisphaerales bacterium]|nr:hypothetical protein [Phycisphaerales bacterium]
MPPIRPHGTGIIDLPNQWRVAAIDQVAPMRLPTGALMCTPDHFDIIDVKNPHMAGNLGAIDRSRARRQWESLGSAFGHACLRVDVIPSILGCEDMVFCANPVFTGLDVDGHRVCVPARMRHDSRQRETPALVAWFQNAGYSVHTVATSLFEGGGDAVWHPGRRLIWGGYGHRTDPAVYEELGPIFQAPVIRLKLMSEHFYHLDTCLCAVDENTALINPASFDESGLGLIRSVFKRVIECPADEAIGALACNAVATASGAVILPAGAPRTAGLLTKAGYSVIEVDTSEFQKSGGSCYCMKMWLW